MATKQVHLQDAIDHAHAAIVARDRLAASSDPKEIARHAVEACNRTVSAVFAFRRALAEDSLTIARAYKSGALDEGTAREELLAIEVEDAALLALLDEQARELGARAFAASSSQGSA